MTEQFRLTPESEYNPQAPEVREVTAGQLGKPPPDPEQTAQGGDSSSPERDRGGQAEEGPPAHGGRESTHVQQKLSKAVAAKTIGVSLGTLYRYINWGIINVEPDRTIDAAGLLRARLPTRKRADPEELRKKRLEYYRVNREKKLESNRRWRQRWKELKEQGDPRVLALTEASRSRRRQRYHERKEQRKLQAEQQPTQIFPDHPKK